MKDNALITVEDVPQEVLSFIDISGAQAVCYNGKVYIGRTTCCIWTYDTIAKEWKKLDKDAPYKNYGLAMYRGKLTIVGGSDVEGRLSKSVMVYDEENNKWNPDIIKAMSRPRENPAVAATDAHLIAMGGTSTKVVGLFLTPLNTIEIYDGEKWSLASTSLQRPGDTMHCFIQDGFLYVLNSDGWTARYCNISALINSSKPENKKKKTSLWRSIPRDVPHTRSCVFVWENTLLAISGAGSDGLQYAFDPKTSRWNRIKCRGSLPAIKNATCLWVGSDQLFLCGGNIDMFTDASKASFMLNVSEDDGSFDPDDNTTTTSITIAGQNLFLSQGYSPQSFHWEKYGFRMHCPEGAMSEGTEVAVTAIASGNFKVPKGTTFRGVGRNFRKGGQLVRRAKRAAKFSGGGGGTPFWGGVTPFSAILTN